MNTEEFGHNPFVKFFLRVFQGWRRSEDTTVPATTQDDEMSPEAASSLEQALLAPPPKEPEAPKEPVVSDKLVAKSGEPLPKVNVLTQDEQVRWKLQKSEQSLFLQAIDDLSNPQTSSKDKPLATLGEQVGWEKLVSKTEQNQSASNLKAQDAAQEQEQEQEETVVASSAKIIEPEDALFLQAMGSLQDKQKATKHKPTKHKPLVTLGEQVGWEKVGRPQPEVPCDLPKEDLAQEKAAPKDAISTEEQADQALFLAAWDNLEKKRSHPHVNEALSELGQKLQAHKPNVKPRAQRLSFEGATPEEAENSKLFMRAVNKLEQHKKAPVKQAGLNTLAEQFPQLGQVKSKLQAPKKTKVPKPKVRETPVKVSAEEEREAFLHAVTGTTPLNHDKIIPPNPKEREINVPTHESLAELLEGRFTFECYCRDEYFEGYIAGLDQLTVDKLRTGMYSPEAHLDLHGFVVEEAYQAVRDFIRSCWYKGLRTILLVPGRGHNSIAGIGILRSRLQCWLTHDPLKRVVLAFCTAQPSDGGPGSVYVLLRKYRKKGRVQWERQIDDYINA